MVEILFSLFLSFFHSFFLAFSLSFQVYSEFQRLFARHNHRQHRQLDFVYITHDTDSLVDLSKAVNQWQHCWWLAMVLGLLSIHSFSFAVNSVWSAAANTESVCVCCVYWSECEFVCTEIKMLFHVNTHFRQWWTESLSDSRTHYSVYLTKEKKKSKKDKSYIRLNANVSVIGIYLRDCKSEPHQATIQVQCVPFEW